MINDLNIFCFSLLALLTRPRDSTKKHKMNRCKHPRHPWQVIKSRLYISKNTLKKRVNLQTKTSQKAKKPPSRFCQYKKLIKHKSSFN